MDNGHSASPATSPAVRQATQQSAHPGNALSAPDQPGQMHPLAVVATPIGNLGDVTARAVDTLRAADVILAEDTRVAKQLMQHIGAQEALPDSRAKLVALHEHNEAAQIDRVAAWLAGGQRVALVSDAGTPLISDPGFVLIRALRQAGFAVQAVPGACALIAALSVSGMPTDRFCFEGFLPAKAGPRATALAALADEPRTLVFYEAPHRIAHTLEAMCDAFGADREAVLARELTKRFETVVRLPLAELRDFVANDSNQQRGEIVLVVAGAPKPKREQHAAELDRLLPPLLEALPTKQAVKVAVELTGMKKNTVYEHALSLQRDDRSGAS